ncbi:diguanylate cyclase [Aestuariibacter sp. AA17]|uniref:Diguanylate cyclase n=1 Tax=Fluctibacter corallii TaxID=2984329 RepID=A0ABT3A8K0_9ALTE|nr:diguanylate cyclase [Aestuariibacter sp. AA17]MCV2885014.1 diguanylate cyclase [Aestuariibacter sp. AA17]
MNEDPITLLVVDDLRSNLFALEQMLAPLKVNTILAEGAQAGLKHLLHSQVDIVILDYSMPGMNGVEMAKLIHQQYSEPPPILFVTAHGNNVHGLEQTCYQVGAMDFIEKPIHEVQLVAKLKVLITLVKQREEMRRLATVDILTGLPNRLSFQDTIKQNMSLASRQKSKLGLLAFDLDDFKGINDKYGHDVGDALLIEFAKRLSNSIRTSDYAARIGGDEFVCLLTNIHNDDEVKNIAKKISEQCNGTFHYEGKELRITASTGAALYPDHGETPSLLSKAADVALYDVKANHKGSVKLCNSQDHRASNHERVTGHIKLGYQPIYDRQRDQIIGGEIFCRLENANEYGGIRGTIEHIRQLGLSRTFEKTLKDKLLGEVCTSSNSANLSGIQLFLNQSSRELINYELNQQLIDLSKQLESKNLHLTIDVSDWERARDMPLLIKHLATLHDAGIGLCIQDIGETSIPVAMLLTLRPEYIKLSRVLITSFEHNTIYSDIIDACCKLSQAINARLIAVGIETESQFHGLKQKTIQHFQGHLWDLDLNVDDFTKAISQHKHI